MKDLIQAQEKEFDEKFTFQDMLGIKALSPIIVNDRRLDEPFFETDQVRMIKTWHKSSTKALLEAVIEVVDKQGDFMIEDPFGNMKEGFFKADLQDKLKEEMRKIRA